MWNDKFYKLSKLVYGKRSKYCLFVCGYCMMMWVLVLEVINCCGSLKIMFLKFLDGDFV